MSLVIVYLYRNNYFILASAVEIETKYFCAHPVVSELIIVLQFVTCATNWSMSVTIGRLLRIWAVLQIYQVSRNFKTVFRVASLRSTTINFLSFHSRMAVTRAARWRILMTGNGISFALEISAFSSVFQCYRPPRTLKFVALKKSPKFWNGSGQKKLESTQNVAGLVELADCVF